MINKNDNIYKSQNKALNQRKYLTCNKQIEVIWIFNKLKISLLIKIVEIIILIAIFYTIYYRYFNIYNNKNKIENNKFLEETFDPINIEFKKSINFVKTCESKDLIYFQSSIDNKLKDPKISVVIPLYNCERYILRAIKSVQLQNMSDFEIVLIDDHSTDNTYKLVSKIQNEDKRIRILKNRNNRGILYITQINEKGNFDIVEFKAISNKKINRHILNSKLIDSKFTHPNQFILYQPKLGMFPISIGKKPGTYGLNDIFLWCKCIKTKIYQKALNKLGPHRYSRLMIRYEDIITNYMILNVAESFIYVKKYGIYHIVRSGSGVDIGWNKIPRIINILYLVDVVIDFSLDNIKNKKLAAYLIIYFLRLARVKKTLKRSRYRMNLFISCLKRVFSSAYISENDKNIIRTILKKHSYINFKEV